MTYGVGAIGPSGGESGGHRVGGYGSRSGEGLQLFTLLVVNAKE